MAIVYGWVRGIVASALIIAGAGACDNAEQQGVVAIIDVDMSVAGDGGESDVMPDAAPDMMADAAVAPARLLVERAPLPFGGDNRVIAPSFDPRADHAWEVDPPGEATRVFDHRWPFAAPALRVDGTGESPYLLGAVKLSMMPLAASVWVGVEWLDGVPIEEQHTGRARVSLVAFSPARGVDEVVEFRLSPRGEPVEGPWGLVWRRFDGITTTPTLGLGWLFVSGTEGTLAAADPRVVVDRADPAALTVARPPAMIPQPVSPARLRALDAVGRPPMPPPVQRPAMGPDARR